MMSDYDAIQALNWSSLKHMATSPRMYRWHLDHEPESKPSFVIGGAVHCAVLEPERFDQRYAVYDGIRRGKAWDAWLAEHPGMQSLKPHEAEIVLAAKQAVYDHPVAAKLLEGGRVEEPVTWVDPDTGLECKGRLDYIRPCEVLDLKSASDPAPWAFQRAAAKYLYHGQLAWYHYGAIAARLIPHNAPPPFVVAVQTAPPFDVVAYQMNITDLLAGRALCVDLMQRLMACIEADYWPGVAPELQQLQLPSWAPGLASAEEEMF